MNAWDYCKQAWQRWKTFDGRARRKEYWYFALLPALFVFVFMIVAAIVIPNLVRSRGDHPIPGAASDPISTPMLLVFYLLGACFVFLYIRFLVASLAVSVRRLHDTGHSGWWVLFGAIPLIGAIYVFYLHCIDSQPGDNQYGPNPKAPAPFDPRAEFIRPG
jgi:uncharacterized membrane protein YhaH (DUF805 family)